MANTVIAASLQLDSTQATNSVKSFKTQLREATQSLVQIQTQFGDASTEALQAARNVAELRDRIQDAREVTQLFNPAARFQAFSNVLGVVTNGVTALTGAMALFGDESKDVQAALLKVQGAMALSQGLSALGNAAEDFSRLKAVAIDAFKGIKTAIGSTGIGLIVIALGLLVTYFDDIKEALFGVSAEQKKVLETTTKLADKEKERLGHIDDQDNILKQQGKTEKQILELKEKQTLEVITAAEAQLDAQKSIQDSQIKNAQRNHDILFGLIELVSIPLLLITKTIDVVLQKVGVNSQLTQGLLKGINAASNVVFDPVSTKKKADLDNQAMQDGITKLKNTYAGYQLQIKAINKEAAAKEAAFQAELKALRDAAGNALITDADRLAQIKLKQDYDNQRKSIAQEVHTKEQRNQLLQALEEKYQNESGALTIAKIKELDDKIAIARSEAADKKKADLAQGLNDLKNGGLTNLQGLQELNQQVFETQQNAIDEQAKASLEAAAKLYGERYDMAKGNAELELELTRQFEEAKTEISRIQNEARLKEVSDVFGRASDLFGKNTAAYKVLAIAQATINTYIGVSDALAAKSFTVFDTVLKFVNAGLILASGLANVKKIIAVQVPGATGGTAPSSAGVSVGAPITPQVQTTQLPQDQINQLGQAGNQTVKAYVISGDVSSAQEREARVSRAAKLGG